MTTPLRFAAIGIDHRHIFGMAQNMIDAGAEFAGWFAPGMPNTLDGFLKRFPDIAQFDDVDAILNDDTISLILIAAIPSERASWAVRAMEAGKDVMSDKPGCTNFAQLEAIKRTVAATGRIWSVNFSERMEVPSATLAEQLVADGAIGKVVQTIGTGPHRLNRDTRPDWFFKKEKYGGILIDIASHQIDQFLAFTGSQDAEITLASVANYANPADPELEDFGEIALRSSHAHGYIRVDWYTPDALPTWGDGRLTILGTDGYIELRKYVDIAQSNETDHLFLVTHDRYEKIDASQAGLPYFPRLISDIQNRTDTAMRQSHVFKVCELALRAQEMAEAN